MKKNFSFRVATILTTTSAIITGLAVTAPVMAAWGPERPSFTNEEPASYPVFNSIKNNAAVGDEFNFVRVGEADSDAPYTDSISIEAGKEYEVYIYYHNNAAGNLNDDGNGAGVAKLVRVAATYPTLVNKGTQSVLTGVISASNTNPLKVWDEAFLTTESDDAIVLRYKTGSAKIHDQSDERVRNLSPKYLFSTNGTLIGSGEELDGTVYGCAEYSGYITYTLVAEKADFEFSKQVSVDGETWAESIERAPGQYATYHVSFKNTGNTDFNNLIMSDIHDEGLTIRPGSVKIFDVNHVDGETIDDGILENVGYNFGTVAAGALVQLNYQAKVADEGMCGKTLNNTIQVNYNQEETFTDSATVKVVCEETPEELPNAGPAEIVMAILIVLGITGGGFYLWRTHRTLKTVENNVSGNALDKNSGSALDKDSDKDSSQKPDNMVQ